MYFVVFQVVNQLVKMGLVEDRKALRKKRKPGERKKRRKNANDEVIKKIQQLEEYNVNEHVHYRNSHEKRVIVMTVSTRTKNIR